MYDVIVIGAGPAGLSSALYIARAGLKTLVVGIVENSNAYKAHVFENYLGSEKPMSGKELMINSLKQVLSFKAEFLAREVTNVTRKENKDKSFYFEVLDNENEKHETRTVVIACGLGLKSTGVKNEKDFIGRGVSYCATCDGPFFKNKKVAVVGNSDFAAAETLDLLTYTSDITILSHGKPFSFSQKMQKVLGERKILLKESSKIIELIGLKKLGKIKFADGAEENFDGLFIAIGKASAIDFANKLGLEKAGQQGNFLKINLTTGETNMSSVYAAGDVTGGNAQIMKSAGEGCNAGISVIKFIKGLKIYIDYH